MRECWVIEEQDKETDEWRTVDVTGNEPHAQQLLTEWRGEYSHRVVRYVPEPGEEWVDALKWKLAALLKDRTRRDIRARVRNGESAQSVAEDFGVPVQFVEVVSTWQMFEDAPTRKPVRRLEPLKTGTCPRCHGINTNSEQDGGNQRCYHCGQCGYVECEHDDDADTPCVPAPPQEDREP